MLTTLLAEPPFRRIMQLAARVLLRSMQTRDRSLSWSWSLGYGR